MAGLEAPKLQTTRKRKPDAENNRSDWTTVHDVALLQVVWSGARGESRRLPGRTAHACKLRLQAIHKHLAKSVTHFHESAPHLVALVSEMLSDAVWSEVIAAERQRIRGRDLAAASADFLNTAAAETSNGLQCVECTNFSQLDHDALELTSACHSISISPQLHTQSAADLCNRVLHSDTGSPSVHSAVDSENPNVAADDEALSQLLQSTATTLLDAIRKFQRDVSQNFMATFSLSVCSRLSAPVSRVSRPSMYGSGNCA